MELYHGWKEYANRRAVRYMAENYVEGTALDIYCLDKHSENPYMMYSDIVRPIKRQNLGKFIYILTVTVERSRVAYVCM